MYILLTSSASKGTSCRPTPKGDYRHGVFKPAFGATELSTPRTAGGTQVLQTTSSQAARGYALGGSLLTVCAQLARDALQRRRTTTDAPGKAIWALVGTLNCLTR